MRRYLPGDRTYLCVRCIGRRYGSPGRRHARGQERVLVGHPSLTVTVQSHPNVDAVKLAAIHGAVQAWAVTLGNLAPSGFSETHHRNRLHEHSRHRGALRAALRSVTATAGRQRAACRSASTCRFDRRSHPTNSN